MAYVNLPMLAGTREHARVLLATHDVPLSLAGEMFGVFCRELLAGSATFADELVKQVLVLRDAAELALVGVSDEFEAHVRSAAARRGVADRVRVRSGGEVDV